MLRLISNKTFSKAITKTTGQTPGFLATKMHYSSSLNTFKQDRIMPSSKITVLKNGLIVASETHPNLLTSTIGVYVDTGSRAETENLNGVAHFLEHMAFKGTQVRSGQQLELEIENMGAHLNAYTSREQTAYFSKCHTDNVPQVVDILSDILQNSQFNKEHVERERDVILTEQIEVNKVPEEFVFDHLHAACYQGHSLGYTILGPEENIKKLSAENMREFINTHYSPERVALVGVGNVEHETLVKLAEQKFTKLPAVNKLYDTRNNLNKRKPHFTGSEVRIRDDAMKEAYIAMAVEAVGWNHKDFYKMLILSSIIGNWDRSMGATTHLSSRLAQVVHSEKLANSFMSFNTSYSDTGLFGIFMHSENYKQLDDLQFCVLQQWNRLTTSVTDMEIERAKQQLKASLLFSLDNTTAIADDIARQVLTTRKRVDPLTAAQIIDKIKYEEIRECAEKYLWDKEVSVIGYGSTESLMDFNRVRSNMSWNRA